MKSNSATSYYRINFFVLSSIFLLLHTRLSSQTIWTQIGQKNPAEDITNYDPNISGIGLVHRVMFEPGYNGRTKTRLFAWSYSGLWVSPSGQGNDWKIMNTDQLDDGSFSAIAVDPNNRDHIIGTTGTLSAIKIHSIHHKLEYKYSTGFWNGHFDTTSSKWEWKRIPGCSFKDNSRSRRVKEADFFEYSNHRLMTNVSINEKNSKEMLCLIVEMINPTDPVNETFISSIYKSKDGGVTWIKKFQVEDFFLKDIVAIGNNVFVTGKRNASYTSAEILFRSTDFGNKWDPDYCVSDLIHGNKDYEKFFHEFTYYNVAKSPDAKSMIFLAGFTNASSQTLRIDFWKSTGPVDPYPVLPGFSVYNDNGKSDAFDVNPNYSSTFLYGGWILGYVRYSSNQAINNVPKYYGGSQDDFHQDVRDVIYYPVTDPHDTNINCCIVACDGGVFKGTCYSSLVELKFRNISNGLEMLNSTDISCTQNPGADEVIVNSWDNGIYKYTPDRKWIHSGIEGGEITVKPTDYNKYYYQYFPSDGSSYTEGYTNRIVHSRSEAVYDSKDPNRFFLIDNNSPLCVILVKEDSLGNLKEKGIGINDNDLTAIDICASNPDVIVVAKFFRIPTSPTTNVGRLYRTTDGGLNWSIADVPFSDGNLNEITDIVISSSNPNKMWVSDYSNKVAYTHDGGKNWETQILPEDVKAIYCLYYLRGSDDLVFAGTSSGLYVYVTSQNTWVQYNTYFSAPNHFMPRSIITGIDFNYTTQTMYISTFGRGVWKGKK